jgi:hypothetical protein
MKNANSKELQHITWLSLALFVLSGYLWSQQALFTEIKIPNVLTIHTGLETATIIIFASVFIVCWNAFGNLRKLSSLILAVTFLSAAIFGFFHTISFQGMPGFPGAIDMHKSFSFWLLSRYLISFTLLGLVLQSKDTDISDTRSHISVVLGLIATIALIYLIFRFPEILPATYLKDLGQTDFKIHCEMVLVGTNTLTAILLYRRIISSERINSEGHLKIKRSLLFFSAAMMAISETYFSLYRFPDEIFVVIWLHWDCLPSEKLALHTCKICALWMNITQLLIRINCRLKKAFI